MFPWSYPPPLSLEKVSDRKWARRRVWLQGEEEEEEEVVDWEEEEEEEEVVDWEEAAGVLEGMPRGGKKGRTLGEAKKPKKVMATMAKRANNINNSNACRSSSKNSSSGLLRPEGSNSVGVVEPLDY